MLFERLIMGQQATVINLQEVSDFWKNQILDMLPQRWDFRYLPSMTLLTLFAPNYRCVNNNRKEHDVAVFQDADSKYKTNRRVLHVRLRDSAGHTWDAWNNHTVVGNKDFQIAGDAKV